MRKTQKLLALLLVTLFMLSLLAACNSEKPAPGASTDPSSSTAPGSSESSPSAAPADPNRTLNVQVTQDSGTLYPLGVTGGFYTTMYAFYEPLFDTNPDGSRKWILATGLDRISDLQYTLTIREGVTFSNGNPLTAEDVMFTMETCNVPQYSLVVKVVDFEKTKVTGDYTIDLWYTQYNASQEPGFAQMLIMDKESYDDVALTTKPIGTGPYVVTDYTVNSHLTVTARDDYWGGAPSIKNIEFKVINEPAQVINALETKEVDLAAITVDDADYVKSSLGYDVTKSNGGYSDVVLFSLLDTSPLASKEARYAVSYAIDRQAIVDIIYKGLSTVPKYPASQYTTDFEQRFNDMHDTYITGYNKDKAKEYAEKSGLVGKTVRIITNGAATFNTMAEMIQQNLIDIGIKAEIKNYDQATYFPTIMDPTNFDIALFNPGTPSKLAIDALAMYPTFISLGWTGPDRDKFGELSMGAIATYDITERGNKIYEALKVFEDVDPWFALSEAVGVRAQLIDLTGVKYMVSNSIYYQDIAFK